MSHDDWTCGLHSGIPECCIRWYVGMRHDSTEGFTAIEDSAWDRWMGVTWRRGSRVGFAGNAKPTRGFFVPCPNHRRVPPRIVLRDCACVLRVPSSTRATP